MRFSLENDQVSAVFDHCGQLLSLKNLVTGTELVRPGFLWRLIIGQGSCLEEEIRADWNIPKMQQNGNRLTIFHRDVVRKNGNRLKVALTISAELTDNDLSWKIRIDNRDDGAEIRECLFPVIQLSEATSAMALHTSNQGGEVLENLRGELMAVAPRYQNKDELFRRLIYHYPGSSLATNSFAFANGREGLYCGCHDNAFEETLHLYELDVQGSICCGFDRIPFLKSGGSREYSGYQLSPYTGTWHYGALKYRKWADTWLDFHPAPQWIDKLQGWQRIIARTQYGANLYHFSTLESIFNDGRQSGIDTVFLLGWHRGGHDNDYPEYIPSDELGGENALKENIRKVREAGGHVILYFNGQLIDRTSKFYRETGYRISCKDMYGNEITERRGFGGDGLAQRQYGARTFAVLCPHVPEYFELLTGCVDRAVEYGCDGVFFDQLGKAAPVCWSPDHGHQIPFAESTRCRAELIRRLKEYTVSVAPDMAFGVEHVTDLTAQHCDFIHAFPGGANLRNPGWEKNGERPRINIDREWFRFIFPEVRLSNRDLRDRSEIVRRVNRMLLDNLLADAEVYRCRKTIAEIPEYQEYLRKVIDFRKTHASLLQGVRFRSNLDFHTDSNEADTAGYLTTGNEIVILATQFHRPELVIRFVVPNASLCGHAMLGSGELRPEAVPVSDATPWCFSISGRNQPEIKNHDNVSFMLKNGQVGPACDISGAMPQMRRSG